MCSVCRNTRKSSCSQSQDDDDFPYQLLVGNMGICYVGKLTGSYSLLRTSKYFQQDCAHGWIGGGHAEAVVDTIPAGDVQLAPCKDPGVS